MKDRRKPLLLNFAILGLFLALAAPASADVVLQWDGSCVDSQVAYPGANDAFLTITKTTNGAIYDVVMEGTFNRTRNGNGYVRHGLLPGLLPLSPDPSAYVCEVQTQGGVDTSDWWNCCDGVDGIHVVQDGGTWVDGTIWFPDQGTVPPGLPLTGEWTLRCAWQTAEADDTAAWDACAGVTGPPPVPASSSRSAAVLAVLLLLAVSVTALRRAPM